MKFRVIHLLILLHLLVGVFIYKDYGFSWDENISRTNGLVNVKYIVHKFFPSFTIPDEAKIPDLKDYFDKDHTCAFEIILVGVEFLPKMFAHNITIDKATTYHLRHLLTFLSFWIACIYFYRLLKAYFKDEKLAVLGYIMLILTPRIFADSFYNDKDLANLSFFLIATFTGYQFLKNPTFKRAFWHALLTGFLVGLRVPSIIMLFLTAGIFAVGWIAGNYEQERRRLFAIFGLYVSASLFFIFLFFPYLWENPVGNFITAFHNMSHFSRWDNHVLVGGKQIEPTDLSWNYLPIWITITVPITYLLLSAVGSIAMLRDFFTTKFNLFKYIRSSYYLDSFFLALLFVPIVSVIVLHSVVYNGWRHLYFTYPLMVLVAVKGLDVLQRISFLKDSRLRSLPVVVLLLTFIYNTVWMIKNHPHQQVYFNTLIKNPQVNYDLDYWGVSLLQAYQQLAIYDKSPEIKVAIDSANLSPAEYNILLLPKETRERFKITDRAEADYYVTFTNPYNYKPMSNKEGIFADEVVAVYATYPRGRYKISGAYRLHH